jgi:hypothetical protein
LAQISGVCLSCIRYRVTAKSTRRIAMTIQILMRDMMGMKPRCEWNSPTGVREFCWRRVSSLGQGRGSIDLPRPEHVEVEKKAPPFRRARLRSGALDISESVVFRMRANSERGDWFQKKASPRHLSSVSLSRQSTNPAFGSAPLRGFALPFAIFRVTSRRGTE